MQTSMTKKRKVPMLHVLIIALLCIFIVLPAVVMIGLAVSHQHSRSARPAETIVPQLIGLDVKKAEAKARETKLSAQVLLKRWDIPAPVGTIVDQVPPAGASVPLGTPIGLEMSVADPNAAFWEAHKLPH
jgi:beta-lactam-binding protein with PASTA domain